MSRIRYLKPEFFLDEDVAELSFAARLLFQGLWTLADREGRLEDRPSWIRVLIFPYDNAVNTTELLDELCKSRKHSAGTFIERYTVGDQRFIQIKNFKKHQKPHHKEQPSVIPSVPSLTRRGKVRASPEKVGASPGKASASTPCIREREWVMGNGGGKEQDAYVPPDDVRTENAIRDGTVVLERKLLAAVGRLAATVYPPRDELSIMREVTAYKKPDGTVIPGRSNPSGLTSERLEKSLADAESWLTDLSKPAVTQ